MLSTAVHAAKQAGRLLRRDFGKRLKVREAFAHDIKLELDVLAQELIERAIQKKFPRHAIVGEEGVKGVSGSDHRWIIDPLDGTANFSYSIPHFCVSIACQRKDHDDKPARSKCLITPGWTTVLGVIYDPIRDELFAASLESSARLNGRPIRVSPRTALRDAVVSVGFFKTAELINKSLPQFQRLVH